MCSGHPKYHPCQHASMSWKFCPAARCDPRSGNSSRCNDWYMEATQYVTTECPVKYCDWKHKAAGWQCCRCSQGPNRTAWCMMPGPSGRRRDGEVVTCDHGCCENCQSWSPSFIPVKGSRLESMYLRNGYYAQDTSKSMSGSHHRRDSSWSSSGSLSSSSRGKDKSGSRKKSRSGGHELSLEEVPELYADSSVTSNESYEQEHKSRSSHLSSKSKSSSEKRHREKKVR